MRNEVCNDKDERTDDSIHPVSPAPVVGRAQARHNVRGEPWRDKIRYGQHSRVETTPLQIRKVGNDARVHEVDGGATQSREDVSDDVRCERGGLRDDDL